MRRMMLMKEEGPLRHRKDDRLLRHRKDDRLLMNRKRTGLDRLLRLLTENVPQVPEGE